MCNNEDELLFLEEDPTDNTENNTKDNWKILIADDDKDIHTVTKMALTDFEFKNKGLTLYSAFSGKEAISFLEHNTDTALVLLDVVMEEDYAGLNAVNHIRNILKNKFTRIILRTGQPGQAPEKEVIINYDINDYKIKTELSIDRLYTSIITALRDYSNLITIDNYAKNLELLVKDRTKEIEEQNEILIYQTKELKAKSKALTSSLMYAKRIQKALLPSKSDILNIFPKSFIFYQPKNYVSGDFYWIKKIDNKVIFVVADCSGHGVPAAFLSIVGSTMLEQATIDIPEKASDVLNKVKNNLVERLNNDNEGKRTNETIDLALVIVDLEQKIIQFSGAFNSMIFISDNNVSEIKGDKIPVGYNKHYKDKKFSDYILKYKTGDSFYLFTDGCYDQFGGLENKRYYKKNLIKLIENIHTEDIEDQETILSQSILNWKNGNDQTDDMLLIGITLD